MRSKRFPTSLRWPRLLPLACVLAIALSACNTSPEQLNRAAEVVLTRSAELTPGALPAGDGNTANAPTRDPNAKPVTATPSLVFALCIVRAESQLHIEPNADADFTAALQASDVITAYGRTADAAWVLGWNKDDNYGWVTASAVGCTVPTPELMPTEPNVLRLTPVAVVAAAATPATDAAPAPSPTAEPTLAAPTDTPIPPTTAATDTPEPAPTTAETAQQPAPTNTAERVSTTTPTSAAAAETPSPTQTPIVIIQIVTVVVTVTAAPAAVTVTPTLAPVQSPTPTPTLMPTAPAALSPTPALTSTAATTATSALVVLQQVRCVVTPGTPVNLRRGPARTERLLGTLRAGAPFVVTGRNEAGDWLYGVTARGTIGWLITSAVGCESDANKLPVVDR